MEPWLARLRHDLVKRAVWAGRDLRDQGGSPSPADLLALRRGLFELRDAEGALTRADQLWRSLRAQAPRTAPPALLDAFGAALLHAQEEVERLSGDGRGWQAALAAVLQIEASFEALSRAVAGT